jgi:hypothetical protein
MSVALTLPVYLPIRWDKNQNATAFVGIRDATSAQLVAAASHERDRDVAMLYTRLRTLFVASGGQPGAALSSVLRFAPRPAGSRTPKPTSVRVIADLIAEMPVCADA